VWRFVAAACLAAVVLATAVLVPVMRRRIDTPQPAVAEASAILQDIFHADEVTVENLPESVGGFVERPLAAQLETIAKQTESAVRFLIDCTIVQMPGTGQMQ